MQDMQMGSAHSNYQLSFFEIKATQSKGALHKSLPAPTDKQNSVGLLLFSLHEENQKQVKTPLFFGEKVFKILIPS